MLLEAAAESEGLQEESEVGFAGSARETFLPSQLKSVAGDSAIGRPQIELGPGSSPFSEETETNQRPRGAASKLRHPFALLLFLLLATAAASSGFALAGRKKWGDVAVGSPPASDEAGAAAAEAGEKKQLKLDEALAACRVTAEQEKVVAGFERMFVEGTHAASSPLFLRGRPVALEHFKSFVVNYKADLKGANEEDRRAREKRRLWTLFKMQMATLSNVEIMTLEHLGQLPMSEGNKAAFQEANEKLKKVYKSKVETAVLWMKRGGFHPDSTLDETVRSLLWAQKALYERTLNQLNGVGDKPTSKAALYEGDPRLDFKKLCEGLKGGDQWLAHTMP
ncbi:hypothetical protein Emag_003116 [Eimeria magna]